MQRLQLPRVDAAMRIAALEAIRAELVEAIAGTHLDLKMYPYLPPPAKTTLSFLHHSHIRNFVGLTVFPCVSLFSLSC